VPCASRLKSLVTSPADLSVGGTSASGLTPQAFQQTFLAALHFKTLLTLGLLVKKKKKANTQTNTKDRKLLKLKIQSNHGYCVRLNKGKYLTLCPGFQMSSPKPVESVSDSWLFHLS